jgi:Retron-type reverse transcriptase
MLKKNKLRYNEYYDMQSIYDQLYTNSKNGNNFYKLIEIVGSEDNIRLAYRRLKTNKGSKTAGIDEQTIKELQSLTDDELIAKVREMLEFYIPESVRRVWIPKQGSNKKRPLGIPTIWDRLFQQCLLQVLEPICEAKFHPHSYGFRPNRSTHHAVSRVVTLINISKHHYCVDIDIQGFFDDVNHGKLLRQLWHIGVRDKRLISILGRLLKAEIVGEGVPTKGTAQGGVISPLLSNVVLNELDWWVSSQWETYQARNFKDIGSFRVYARNYTNLKGGYIVRYADDFKIMCRSYPEAQRFYHATVKFLKDRLGLTINEEKSRVVNLKKNSSEFLGFKIKVIEKQSSKHKFIAKTDMSDKAIAKAKRILKKKVKEIQRNPNQNRIVNYNLTVLGIQNYYKIATNIYNNLTIVSYTLWKSLRVRLKNCSSIIEFQNIPVNFQKLSMGIRKDTKIYQIKGIPMLPLTGQHHKYPRNFSQNINDYIASSRKNYHRDLRAVPKDVLNQVRKTYSSSRSIEYNDNRISRYIAQYGKCYVTKRIIDIDRVHCHHILPIRLSGNDSYENLVVVDEFVHRLIHATSELTIGKLLATIKLTSEDFERLNILREQVKNLPLNLDT